MKRFTAFGVAPGARVILPSVVEATAGGSQPKLFSGGLPTENKDHAVTECDVDHALGATDIDIIRQ